MRQYAEANRLIRFAQRTLGVPVHEHPSTYAVPEQSTRQDFWLQPDGLHVIKARVKVGRLAHELGHYCLMRPCDRKRVQPGDLIDHDIDTCMEDLGAEAWGFAVAMQLGIGETLYFEEREDYMLNVDPDSPIGGASDPRHELFALYMGTRHYARDTPSYMLLNQFGFANEQYPNRLLRYWATEEDCDRYAEFKQRAISSQSSILRFYRAIDPPLRL